MSSAAVDKENMSSANEIVADKSGKVIAVPETKQVDGTCISGPLPRV